MFELPIIIRYALIIFGFIIIIFVHELGHFLAAKISRIKVTDFSLGFGKPLLSYKKGETTYKISPILLGGYVKISGQNFLGEEKNGDEKRSFKNAPFIKKLFILVSGSVVNLTAAFILLSIGLGFIGLNIPVSNGVADVQKGLPAEKILKPGDRIIFINGKKTRSFKEISKEIKKNPNEKIRIIVLRANKRKAFIVKTVVKNGKGIIGFTGPLLKRTRSLTIKESIVYSARVMVNVIHSTNVAIWQGITGKSDVIVKQSGSVVGAVKKGAEQSRNFLDIVIMIGFFNLIIGYLNLFPLPPLDGGHVVIYVIERLKGSEISKKVKIGILAFGTALLVPLMLFLIVRDIITL